MVTEVLVSNGRLFFDSSNIRRSKRSTECLNRVIQDFNTNHIADDEYDNKLSRLISDLKSDVHKCLHTSDIHVFGSAVNGFRSHSSDVDCFIELDENGYDKPMTLLQDFFSCQSQLFSLKRFIANARVPIVTVIHLETKLDCDISFSVPALQRKDVIQNSKLLKKYSALDAKIPATFRFHKHLLSSTRFSSVRTNGLSTYCHAIMFIYFLKHRLKPFVPHIDINTFEKQMDCGLNYETNPSEYELFLSFLHFISCEFDTAKYMMDIRTRDKATRKLGGSTNMGQFCIPDPYVNQRDLGKYMREQHVYEYKVFCYKLLNFLSNNSLNTDQLREWCDSPCFVDKPRPPLHPDCDPLYQIQRNPKLGNKRRSSRIKTPMRANEDYSITLSNCLRSRYDTQPRTITIQENFDKNFGSQEALQKLVDMIDTGLSQLQTIIVFENETLAMRAQLLLHNMTEMSTMSVSTFKCKECRVPQVYLTTYYHSVPKHIDTSTVTSIFVYKPSYYVPISCWSMLYSSTINSEVYFLIPEEDRAAHNPEDEFTFIDELAKHYRNRSNVGSKYYFTLPLANLYNVEPSNEDWIQDVPNNIEIFKIVSIND